MKYEIVIEKESVPIHSMGETIIDPYWTYTDPFGHVHDSTKTHMKPVYENEGWCGVCDDDHISFLGYECALCGADVNPKKVYKPASTTFAYGPKTAKLTIKDDTGTSVIGIWSRSGGMDDETYAEVRELKELNPDDLVARGWGEWF